MGPRPEEATPPNNIVPEMDDTDIRDDNATISEDEPETADTSDFWAVGEGYTPLFDLNNDEGIRGRNSYAMVSTGPGNNSDNDSVGGDGNGDDDDDFLLGTAGRGTFYVNSNAFGNSNGVDASLALISGTEDYNVGKIAASALSALDEEYQQTLTQSHADSSNEKEGDEDLKIIAAGFDEREEELQRICEQGGFIAHWEESDEIYAIDMLDNKQQQQLKKVDDVDTDAVRKVIETLSVKNKDAPFQQKFAIWQHKQLLKRQQQQQHIDSHKLIPMKSYQTFHEPTPTAKSRLASANLSRSATLAEALVRLSLLSSFQGALLLIDIVGVDHVECNSALTIRNTFKPFVKWLEDYFLASQRDRKIHVHFRLIGRELSISTTAEMDIVDVFGSSSTPPSSLRATASCHCGVYHDFLEEKRQAGAKSNEHGDVNILGAKAIPDLVVAFNAGIWGYREWADTIRYLALPQHETTTMPAIATEDKTRARSGLPMVITAYTLDECQEDQEVIYQSITSTENANQGATNTYDRYRADILWESQQNHFGSQVIRETKGSSQEYRENAYWQAWLLGG